MQPLCSALALLTSAPKGGVLMYPSEESKRACMKVPSDPYMQAKMAGAIADPKHPLSDLVNNMEDMPHEFSKAVDEFFWDLVE